MFVRRSLIPIAAMLFAAACADSVGVRPLGDQPSAVSQPHFLRWAGEAPPRFSAIGSLTGRMMKREGGEALAGTPGELSLDQNTATFWAVRGQERSVRINYLGINGDASSPFLRLVITDPVFAPGIGDLAPGDSVLISVVVDPRNIKVSLEPTGLQFGEPAQLDLSYGGAGGDLDGDGVVDSSDAYVETQLLGMWYREGDSNPWTRIPDVHEQKSFTSALPHFSEYAVSW